MGRWAVAQIGRQKSMSDKKFAWFKENCKYLNQTRTEY
jgi:hypothetical protein